MAHVVPLSGTPPARSELSPWTDSVKQRVLPCIPWPVNGVAVKPSIAVDMVRTIGMYDVFRLSIHYRERVSLTVYP